jgi:hypothetical protein
MVHTGLFPHLDLSGANHTAYLPSAMTRIADPLTIVFTAHQMTALGRRRSAAFFRIVTAAVQNPLVKSIQNENASIAEAFSLAS